MKLITLTTIELTEQFCHLITWQYQLRDKQRGWYLSGETQIPLSWSIVADFNGQNHQQSVKSVREIAQAATVAAGSVVLIVPDQQVLNKSLSLPAALSARQCQQALGQAVSQSLSYSMEAVYWDVLRVEKTQEGQRHFELCVVRREVIEACRAMFAALQWPLDMVIPKSALLALPIFSVPILPVEAGGYRLALQETWQQRGLPWRHRLGSANALPPRAIACTALLVSIVLLGNLAIRAAIKPVIKSLNPTLRKRVMVRVRQL